MDILILFTLILFNGVFAMAEIALVTARKTRLKRLAEAGDAKAAAALLLRRNPTRFLSTVQIGITAISILSGIVGESALSGYFETLLQRMGFDQQASTVGATAIVVASITYFAIVIGELVPKRLAQTNAEGIARVMARPVAVLAMLSRPFVYLLSVSTDGVLRLLGKEGHTSATLTEEDILAILLEGSQTGVIEKQEHTLARNVFRLDDRLAVSLMTPRSDIVYLDVARPFEQSLDALMSSPHTRFPVCREGMDEVLGVVNASRLLKYHLEGNLQKPTKSDLTPAVYVPESLTGMKLLQRFQTSGVQMVFVIDEYGAIVGLITLQDLFEALSGEFSSSDPHDVWAVRHKDGAWMLDGLIPIPELKDRLELKQVPDEEKRHYHTLGGMMMCLIGKVPRSGDVAEWQGWSLQVTALDGNRIDKVRAVRLPRRHDSTSPCH
ncbi:hemolysin family protein [Desulfuromonas acetoxidans]|uniref:hemolysin family protein n=1 Tax=Desulfuromonas acetoxidans TaxID=891 RepID=UPI002931DA5F|nr:hemolysin family protein [Desulfuromonas acetoxidans]